MSGLLGPDKARDPNDVGGKAAALSRLVAAGFDVPPFVVLADAAFRANGTTLRADAVRALAGALEPLGPGPYAVRSSARGEDGAEASHAGQFATVLNVPADGVAAAHARGGAAGGSAA